MAEWQDPEAIVLWIIIVFLIVLLLGVVLILFVKVHLKKMVTAKEKLNAEKLKHQEKLLQSSVEIQERERERIAADLHDEILGKLNVLALSTTNPKETNRTLNEIITIARNISHDLSPPLLDETSLEELIREILFPLRNHYSIQVSIRDETIAQTHKNIKLQLVRIIQEVINNIIKHAEATEVSFYFRKTKKYLALKITDNGKGYKVSEILQGLGLKNIELRMQLLKGQYRQRSKIGHGTSILLYIKLQ